MKQIILEPNRPPKFIGDWSSYEALQMAIGLRVWIDRLLQDMKIVQADDKNGDLDQTQELPQEDKT